MIAGTGTRPSSRWLAALALAAALGLGAPAAAQDPPAHDLLNAVLWMQRSVEYKAAALRPSRWPGSASTRPPGPEMDRRPEGADRRLPVAAPGGDPGRRRVDPRQLGLPGVDGPQGTTFDPKTWNAYVNTVTSVPIPGAVEFAQYAAARGVKVFYVSNRTAEEEPATRKNLERLAFPMDDKVDTMLTTRKQPDWGSAKGTRRAFIAKSYRILLNLGDNFADFVDEYRGTEAERQKVMDEHKDRWGREWIMIANPTYGSFESAPFNHDFKLSAGDRRKAKRGVLEAWPGP